VPGKLWRGVNVVPAVQRTHARSSGLAPTAVPSSIRSKLGAALVVRVARLLQRIDQEPESSTPRHCENAAASVVSRNHRKDRHRTASSSSVHHLSHVWKNSNQTRRTCECATGSSIPHRAVLWF